MTGTRQGSAFVMVATVALLAALSLVLASPASAQTVKQPPNGVVTRGNDIFGQMGDGTADSPSDPTGANGVGAATAVDAGASHALAVKSDGTVRSWGSNGNGQLGRRRPQPRREEGRHRLGAAGIVTVSASHRHGIDRPKDETKYILRCMRPCRKSDMIYADGIYRLLSSREAGGSSWLFSIAGARTEKESGPNCGGSGTKTGTSGCFSTMMAGARPTGRA